MAKDSYYFQHDYNSRNDEKILELRAECGAEGYGIYWMLVESLAETDNGYLNKGRIGGLSLGYGVSKETLSKVIDFCIEIGLFNESEEGFYSQRMLDHKEFRRKAKVSGEKGAEARWGNSEANGEAISPPNADPNSPPISTPNGTPNAKERKGKKRKENNNNSDDASFLTQAPPPISVPGETASEMSHRIVTEWQEKKGEGLTLDPIVIQAAFIYKNISEHTGYREQIYATEIVQQLKDLNEPDVNSLNTICKWALKHSFWGTVVATVSSFVKNYPKIKLQYSQQKKKTPQFAD